MGSRELTQGSRVRAKARWGCSEAWPRAWRRDGQSMTATKLCSSERTVVEIKLASELASTS
jgi:hypothetical protein